MSSSDKLPSSVPSLSNHPEDQRLYTPYNLSDSCHDNRVRVRLLRVPGRRTQSPMSQGFHQLKEPYESKWKDVPPHAHVGKTRFSTVNDMPDPATGSPTVAIVSYYYEQGDILQASQNATPEQKMTWLREICFAVKHLHQHKIVHGNIHPRNILIRDDGCAVLMDATIYALTFKHIMSNLPMEELELELPKTLACKSRSAIQGSGDPSQYDDLHALAMSIWMVFEGKDPWQGKLQCFVLERYSDQGRHELRKPSNMTDNLWSVISDVLNREKGSGDGVWESQALECMIGCLRSR